MKYNTWNTSVLEKMVGDCVDECKKIGIHTGNITKVTINNRVKSRLGQCYLLSSGNYEIEISGFFLNENISEKIIRNTVMHEVLHTCDGCMNHGNRWKSYAEKVNNKYGYNVSRLANLSANEEIKRSYYKSSKYMYRCEGCGNIVAFNRRCKFTKYTKHYSCGYCGGSFIKITKDEVA